MTDLINTLEAPGEFDALSKLRKDEPYFLLIGRDRFAAELVSMWSDSNRRRAIADLEQGRIDKETYEREIRKSTEADMIAADMKAYKRGYVAEGMTVVESATSYTGAEVDEETKRRDRLQSSEYAARCALTNAISGLAEVAELLEPGKLKGLVNNLIGKGNELVGLLTPRRPGQP